MNSPIEAYQVQDEEETFIPCGWRRTAPPGGQLPEPTSLKGEPRFAPNQEKEITAMLSYFMVFSAGALVGSLIMGLYVAFVAYRDARSDW